MKTNYKLSLYSFLLVLFLIGNKLQSQEILTVKEAVKLALENNFDIKIATNELKISEDNADIGNAGILPNISGSFTQNNSVQNSTQTLSDGTMRKLNNALNNNFSYGVGLDWTVFDGLRMFARYDQLKELQKLGEIQLKLNILNKISEVITTYYDLVQQQQQLVALDTAIYISQQRLTTAENRYIIGKGSKLDVLNAQVDINTDYTYQLRQKELLNNTKIKLNEILVRNVHAPFRVADTIIVDRDLKFTDLMSLAEKQNPEIQIALLNRRVSELDLKQAKADRYPTISVNTGYTFTESESSLGFASHSSGKGFNYGVKATLNIFDGFNQNRNERNAKRVFENSQFQVDKQNMAISRQLATAYQTYLTNLELTELEKKNEAISRQNLDITLEKFRIGIITTLEFRTAQLNYINARVRNSNAQYEAKLSEIILKEIAGNIELESSYILKE